jgi:hypothetical protein
MRVSCRAFLVLVVLTVASGACSKRHPARHSGGGGEVAAAMAPTPDNTPVEALRTPAGLVLKGGPEPTATPLPAAAEAASKAAPTKS